ncbi:high-potential iron-sulfur protein [Pseudobdellovibrio sp. HCB154]|uniref:high-potential iron-sulfur protein n=1 Tax=Pseudobdellovibrio sp. HCB154 TaxID=3386277 RepID=UPI0039174D7C
MNRRQFLVNSGLASGLLLLLGNKAFSEESRRKKAGGSDPELVSPQNSTAKSVGYIEDFKKSAKAGGGKCSTCSLYVKVKDINGKEVGTCAIFPKMYVLGDAYCNSWAKKG